MANIYNVKEKTGEAWIVSGYKGKESIIKNGPYKGKTLRFLWKKHKDLFGDFLDKEFPVLIKLIDSKEDLSVQVHPNDEYAIKKHNQLGKYECWYILDENKSKDVIVGVNAHNAIELRTLMGAHLLENSLVSKSIKKDDLIIIEPGTVHAIKKDTFLLEVQESSDITYRLYDYNRKPIRQLHIEESLEVINYNNKKNCIHSFSDMQTFDNKHFAFQKIIINGESFYENKGFEIFYVINGQGNINEEKLQKGDAFILTNTENSYKIIGDLEMISIVPKTKNEEMVHVRKVAFITGITRQLGSYMAELLLQKDYEVHGLVQSTGQSELREFKKLINTEKYEDNLFFHIGDMTDSSNINRIIEKIRPDEIYNFASQSHVDLSFDIPEYTANVNALGTIRILDAIKQSGLNTKLLNLSTCQLFKGNPETVPQDENTKFEPNNPYATSKLYAHYVVKNYRDAYHIFACNAIVFNCESPRREDTYVTKKITSFVAQYDEKKKQVLKLGNLEARRDWGFAGDYVIAMWKMLQQEKPDDFVIATNETHTVRELVELAFSFKNIKINWVGLDLNEKGYTQNGDLIIEIDINLFRPLDNKELRGNYEKAKKILEWEPNKKFIDLINLMVNDNN